MKYSTIETFTYFSLKTRISKLKALFPHKHPTVLGVGLIMPVSDFLISVSSTPVLPLYWRPGSAPYCFWFDFVAMNIDLRRLVLLPQTGSMLVLGCCCCQLTTAPNFPLDLLTAFNWSTTTTVVAAGRRVVPTVAGRIPHAVRVLAAFLPGQPISKSKQRGLSVSVRKTITL